MVVRSATGPPRAKLFELDFPVLVGVDVHECGVDLRVGVAHAELVEEHAELDFVNDAIGITIDTFEAVSQWIRAHCRRLRRFGVPTNRALLGVGCMLAGCNNRHETPKDPGPAPTRIEATRFETQPGTGNDAPSPALPPLRGAWLERLSDGEREVVVMPPLGTIARSRLILAVHGAGDRPDWACGGWRLGSLVSALVVCPQGARLTSQTFAWVSAKQLSDRSDAALRVARARFEGYVATAPFIFAGFSQGATLAEPFLRQNAASFPIAILAEGGYATARSPAFAQAFYRAGGRRIVLVCGSAGCFESAVGSKRVLERGGLEVLVVGDPLAGHNLNERMQKALQAAWEQISAPLAGR